MKDDTIDEKLFASCFINPLTAIFSELEGRHYGGGVLELVPSEIRRLYVPLPNIDIDSLNKAVASTSNMDDILLKQGEMILKALPDVSISFGEITSLVEDWKQLRLRRQREDS
ncbi:TPA: hypothetical protein NKU94_003657 [Vibrio parahaemolyticus]|nr:hypothetical protein [Vibrio parahaemolyticus]